MGNPGDDFARLTAEAIKKVYADQLFNQICDYADKIVMDAVVNRTFTSFTGNTVTSYAVGVYQYGRLSYMTFSHSNLRSPLRYKIQRGEAVWLNEPYEGPPRGGVGSVDTSEEFGFETSNRIIRSFKAPAQCPISMFMTTGTEYSAYLEFNEGLDVLTYTCEEVNAELLSNIKPIVQ